MPDPHPDVNSPAGPESSRALSWLVELTAGVRKIRPVEASAAPEVLAAGFTHRVRGAVGSGFAGGGMLDRLAPGPDLADFTAQAWTDGLAGLSDDELIGVLCAWRRQGSWAMAGELAAVSELARRRPAPGLNQDGHLDEEIAVALTLTGRAASRLTGLAAGLARLPGTAAALRAGRIDGPRAAVIAEETCLLDDAAARAVEERVLPAAPGQTTGQLRAACRRAALAVDPRAGIQRRRKAEKDARVEAWLESSGTGGLAGRDLPPAEMIAADQRIDASARWLKARGAVATLEQLRAQVFTAVLAGRAIETLLPAPAGPGPAAPAQSSPNAPSTPGSPGAPSGPSGSSGPGGPSGAGIPGPGTPGGGLPGGGYGWSGLSGSVNLTMPLTAWLGLSDQPGEAAGLGALDAGICRDLSDLLAHQPGSRWCVTLTGPGGQAVAHGCARTGPAPPGAGRPGKNPAGHNPPEAGPPGNSPPGSGPPGNSPPGNSPRGASPRGSGPPGVGPPGNGPPPGNGRPGDGPVAWLAQIAIRGLETGTGPCAHTRETPGYRPSAALRHLIKIRDRRCSAPGCRRPAARCDDDHTIAYDQGGRTCECNLAPLCRRHHRTKQATGWQLTQPTPGTLTWTLPHGRSYTTTPGTYPD
jgi:hypothetical protein